MKRYLVAGLIGGLLVAGLLLPLIAYSHEDATEQESVEAPAEQRQGTHSRGWAKEGTLTPPMGPGSRRRGRWRRDGSRQRYGPWHWDGPRYGHGSWFRPWPQ